MINVLDSFGNIPVSSATIASLYPSIKTKSAKITQLEKANYIIRLKRNLFVVNPGKNGMSLSSELIANTLLAPSYVSMQTALRYYGLIPEATYTIQSMTFKAAKKFHTPIGNFTYTHISNEAFHIGLRQATEGMANFIIASPEKALCDLIANTRQLNLRYKKEALIFLEEDIRFDMDRFYEFSPKVFEEYAKVGKKKTSITTILKLLKNE